MPSLTWKLIALLTLIFAVAVFLWFIFLGPLSHCDRLINAYAVDANKKTRLFGMKVRETPLLELMIREGCLNGTEWDKDG